MSEPVMAGGRTADPLSRPGRETELSEKVRSLRMAPRATASRRSIFPWLLSLILACTTGYLGWRVWELGQTNSNSTGAAATTGSGAISDAAGDLPATSAVAASAPSSAGGIVLEAKGYIIPAHQILVSPKVSGMVVDLDIEEGKRVEAGDVLAVLEKIEYEADAQRTQALLHQAQARLKEREAGFRIEEIQQAQAEFEEAQVNREQLASALERARSLRRSNNITPNDFEEAESSYKAADHRVMRLTSQLEMMRKGERVERIELARAEVAQAQADHLKAQWRLDNCVIRAPIKGTILRKNAERGNIVNPVAFNGSYSVCEMADLSDLEVELDVNETDVSQVFQGQSCTVRCAAYPDRPYQGVVDRLMPIANRARAAVPVRIKIKIPADEEGVYLKPDMGANVAFHAKDK